TTDANKPTTTTTTDANKPATTTTTDANKPATTATTEAAAPAAAMAATTTTAPARYLHAAAKACSIDDIERGETDVDHFLFAKKEALIGRRIVRLGDTGSGHRGC